MKTKYSQSTHEFAVTPPPSKAIAVLVLLGGALPLLIIGGMLWFGKVDSTNWTGLLPALFIMGLVLGLSMLAMKRRSVALVGHTLDVRAALFRERTLVAEIDLQRARMVDLSERLDLRPAFKTLGMSLPGFQAGRFRLHDKLGKAFCLVTERRRVLWLPLHNGQTQLLLSLERPQELLDALRAASDAPARRS
ncbi:MAG: PH domain-containing protein [Pseudomonadota bacterium]|nr:PH domain-containing protein [Pseudomonadota bacterium]MDQ3161194.1 PH domain-containing protein [Pseudomonadota bacterium]